MKADANSCSIIKVAFKVTAPNKLKESENIHLFIKIMPLELTHTLSSVFLFTF